MILNYIKIAWRNLTKNRFFSTINIAGLAFGLTCCLLITAFVVDELSYDQQPAQASQIYRVGLHLTANGGITDFPHVDVAVGAGMQAALPEVAASTRLFQWGQTFVKYGEKQFKEEAMAAVDSNFLAIFSIPFLEGNAKTALEGANSIVITDDFARRYFGTEPALGKLLLVGTAASPRKVTGVIKNIPANTHFHFDAFMSTTGLDYAQGHTWSNVGCYTYLVLNKNASVPRLEAKFPQLVARYVVPEVQHDMGVSLAEAQKSVNTFRFYLQPLTDIHLHSTTKYELEPNGDINTVYVFSVLAVVILLLAIVNFTNLSTASAAGRAKEIGLRKVLGSVQNQLMTQFLVESVLIAFLALILAVGLVAGLLPYSNALSGKTFALSDLINGKTVVFLLLLGVVVGIMAGFYPAFLLSFARITTVLKGSVTQSTTRCSYLRNGLVVFQFAISGALIIATLVAYQQLHFMQSKKQGFDREQVLVIQDTHVLGSREAAFKQQLLRDSRVVRASLSRNIPVGSSMMEGSQIYAKDKGGNRADIQTHIYRVDEDYLPTLGIKLALGRNFSKDFSTDSSAVILNETAVRELGLGKTDPIGKTIVRSGRREFTVVGVVKDFHYISVRQKIAPLMLLFGSNSGAIQVKVKAADVAGFVSSVKQQWEALNPEAPFTYTFLDDRFAALYKAEERTSQLFTVFAVISIVIACLGLFGLAAFTAEQRTKEIGVRKVLGATTSGIVVLLSQDFLVLVLVAVLLAFPLAGWAMHRWLQNFAYRISIDWWVYALAAVLAVGIAFLTVSYQSIKAALMNPVKSLKTE